MFSLIQIIKISLTFCWGPAHPVRILICRTAHSLFFILNFSLKSSPSHNRAVKDDQKSSSLSRAQICSGSHTPSLTKPSISVPSSNGFIKGWSNSTLPFLQIKFTSAKWFDLSQLPNILILSVLFQSRAVALPALVNCCPRLNYL